MGKIGSSVGGFVVVALPPLFLVYSYGVEILGLYGVGYWPAMVLVTVLLIVLVGATSVAPGIDLYEVPEQRRI